ncbi:hypothetical protein MYX07_01295 [Patescibacteria group bacterium AH-259-L07]|nr:hypothetical protein [Patescibacteria group bacterium AH-259-L07]
MIFLEYMQRIESQKFSPKIEAEERKSPEEMLLHTIYQEMKKIAEKTEYAKQWQKKSKRGRRNLSHSIEREKLKPLRDRLVKENPNQAELICILVNLDVSSGSQFLATDFLTKTDDKFIKLFWTQYKTIFKLFHPNSDEHFSGFKRGIVGQAGIFKSLKNMGLKPVLAVPYQDALGVDLFVIQEKSGERTDRVLPIQVKHGVSHTYEYEEGRYKKAKSLKVIPREKIYFPSIVIDEPKVQTYIFSNDLEPCPHSEQDVKSRSKEIGKLVKSLKIICPPHSFNSDTGDPTPEFLRQFEPEIRKYL